MGKGFPSQPAWVKKQRKGWEGFKAIAKWTKGYNPAISKKDPVERGGDPTSAYILPFSSRDVLLMGTYWFFYLINMEAESQTFKFILWAWQGSACYISLLPSLSVTPHRGPWITLAASWGGEVSLEFYIKSCWLLSKGPNYTERKTKRRAREYGPSLQENNWKFPTFLWEPWWYTKTVYHWTNYITLANNNFTS